MNQVFLRDIHLDRFEAARGDIAMQALADLTIICLRIRFRGGLVDAFEAASLETVHTHRIPFHVNNTVVSVNASESQIQRFTF